MNIVNLYKPYEIRYLELDECPLGEHKQDFFKLVYIKKGSGRQMINKNAFPYSDENLFLIMPNDTHYFEVRQRTSFLLIGFNNIYLHGQKAGSQHSNLTDWVRKLEYIFYNNNHQPGCLLRNVSDKPLVREITEAIVREHVNQQVFQGEVIQQLVNTLITVVARNIALNNPVEKKAVAGSFGIVHYIQQHIYAPEKLKAENIAKEFNISINYLSEYFKKHTGESLQQYITHYKIKLVETRLQYSDMRMSEIAWELGFTDESHLNRIFKKYVGSSPSEFRKASRKTAV